MTRRKFEIPTIASSEITPEGVWLNRRQLMQQAGLGALSALGVHAGAQAAEATALRDLSAAPSSCDGCSTTESLTPYSDAISYNNFYEFGTDKSDPARYAHEMSVDPWSVEVGGLVNKPGKLNLEDILAGFLMIARFPYFSFKNIQLEERVPFARILLMIGVLALIALDPPLVLWCLSFVYALSGLLQHLRRNVVRTVGVQEQDNDASQV